MNALPAEEIARVIARVLTAPAPKPRYLIGREAVGLAVPAILPARWRTAMIGRLMRPATPDQGAAPAGRHAVRPQASRVED